MRGRGTIGHVAHGKSTIVKAISGVTTVRFKQELVRNITIKLGYANAKVRHHVQIIRLYAYLDFLFWLYGQIYKCENQAGPRPGCYRSYPSYKEDDPPCERHRLKLERHVSFVDCPGHEVLTATMLTGAAVMDGALLLIAGNEACPQPQTIEHLAAIEIMGLQNIVTVQNKVDLVKEEKALEQQKSIKAFLKGMISYHLI